LTILTEELIKFGKSNDPDKRGFFKVRGANKDGEESKEISEEIKRKFHLATVVTSGKPFTTQSEDMCADNHHFQKYSNPQSKIYLENDSIDLHKQEMDATGKAITNSFSFYEFSKANFSKPPSELTTDPQQKEKGRVEFKFTGKAFMSGSKDKKTSAKNKVALDEKVSTIIKARKVLQLSKPSTLKRMN
jgi:hypothetical protein